MRCRTGRGGDRLWPSRDYEGTITSKSGYVRFVEEFGIEDVPLVGGRNPSLREMFQKLSDKGVRVPRGVAITADAYRSEEKPAINR
jgi:hypothetical protein